MDQTDNDTGPYLSQDEGTCMRCFNICLRPFLTMFKELMEPDVSTTGVLIRFSVSVKQ